VEEQDLDDPTFGTFTDVNRRAQLQAFLLNQFHSWWRHEYLTSLREYHHTSGNNRQHIKPGDIILVHDESPRITWRLAIIEELMKGWDGLVRAAKIRTAQGMTNHPITKLIPLEVSSDMAGNSSTDAVSNSTTDIETLLQPDHQMDLMGMQLNRQVDHNGKLPREVETRSGTGSMNLVAPWKMSRTNSINISSYIVFSV